MILAWLFLTLLMQTADTGSIEGVVVRTGTNEPVGGAHVALVNVDLALDQRISIPSETTDSSGRFKFTAVPGGSYRLLLEANGYVRQEYGQRTFPGAGASVTVASGQAVRNLVASMTPAGAVTGRIVDRNGFPLAAVPVRLMRFLYDENGLKALRPYGTGQTDDRGEYRIYFVTPGKYYVHAGSAQGAGAYGRPRLSPNEPALTYTEAYYPGVTQLSAASTIEVLAGSVVNGIDMRLARQTLYRVSGHVVDSLTGQPPDAPALSLFHFDPAVARAVAISGNTSSGTFTYADGRFEFRGVVPGPYTLAASERRNTNGSGRAMRFGFTRLEVGNADVEGVVVTIPAGASLAGRITLEGQDSPVNAFYEGVRFVSLTRTSDPMNPTMPLDWEAGSRWADDGSFQLNGVTAGEYRVTLQLMRPEFYVKDIRYGVVDALARPFQFTPGQPGRLEILLSPRVAELQGIAFNARSEPASGAQVVLIPEQSRDRAELFKFVGTDQNGRFTLKNIAPGRYRVYVWEAIEPYAWFDPELLRRDEPFSTPIQLSESGLATVSLRTIPAR